MMLDLGRFLRIPELRSLIAALWQGVPPTTAPLLPVHGAGPRRSRKNDFPKLPSSPLRHTAEHAKLVGSLQREFDALGSAPPPADSSLWPDSLVRRWYEDGGRVTVDALREVPPCEAARCLVDRIGEGFALSELDLLDMGPGGLLGADDVSFSAFVERLGEVDMVACRLGLEAATQIGWHALRTEGERALPQMRPGEIAGDDGTVVSGRSPSGARRGDRFALYRELPGGAAEWPGVAAVDEALGHVGAILAARARRPPLNLTLAKRSDTFFAAFPGDGLGYGAHFDGDDACKLTMIAYSNARWSPKHGGCLHLLDEARRCWWVVPPYADTLVVFRSDRVLHKVEPAFEQRFALTCFLSEASDLSERARNRAVLMNLAGDS